MEIIFLGEVVSVEIITIRIFTRIFILITVFIMIRSIGTHSIHHIIILSTTLITMEVIIITVTTIIIHIRMEFISIELTDIQNSETQIPEDVTKQEGVGYLILKEPGDQAQF